MFTDTEFMSAAEKELVLWQWKRFLKALSNCDLSQQAGSDYGYFPTQLDKPFTDRLYKYLSGPAGFIAHYNRRGFLSARFGDSGSILETFRQMQSGFVVGSYLDIHRAMVAELKPNLVTSILERAGGQL